MTDCPLCKLTETAVQERAVGTYSGFPRGDEWYEAVQASRGRIKVFRRRHGDDVDERELSMLLYLVADREWGEDTWELEPEETPHGWVYYARRK